MDMEMTMVPTVYVEEIERLTDEYGVRIHSIVVNRRLKRAIARTFVHSMRMDVAPWIAEGTDEEIVDCARHEYAHALEWVRYESRGHGARWKAIARELGAKPTASKVMERRV
jgi:predicted SprT family Zn-dependent metalloprotease